MLKPTPNFFGRNFFDRSFENRCKSGRRRPAQPAAKGAEDREIPI
jgi:hypothetical protein